MTVTTHRRALAARPAPRVLESGSTAPDELLRLYRLMRLGRAFDERMWLLNRSGRVPFVMPHQGHEAAQAAAALAVRAGSDWVVPYYRDLTLSLGLGMTVEDLMLGFYSRAADPSCGGRQMLGHYGASRLKLVTGGSCVAMHLLHAVGIGLAIRYRDEDGVCLTTFGEGGASEGDFHEAVSFAAIHRLPVIFLCQNNGYAISVRAGEQMPVSVAQRAAGYGIPGVQVDGGDPVAVLAALRQAVDRARDGRGPTIVEALVPRLTPHSSDDDDRRYRSADEIAAARREDPIARFGERLGALGILTPEVERRLTAEIDGLVEAAQAAAERAPDPDPAGLTSQVWALESPSAASTATASTATSTAVSPRRDDATSPDALAPSMTMLEAVRDAIGVALDQDDRVLIFGEDVGVGGVFRATDGLRDRFGARRVFSTPIAESQIVGTAIGASYAGLRPIAEIQFADYSLPAFNQIVNEAARSRYRSNGDFPVPIVIRAPFGGGTHGALYHSQSPEAMYCHAPGLKVVVPSTPRDAKGLILAALRDPDPVLVLEHKKLYRTLRGPVPEGAYVTPIGRARTARPGRHAAVITYGFMVHRALSAAEELAADGIEIEVLDLRTLRPLDEEAVLDAVRRTAKVLLLTEANPFCAVTSELGMLIAERAFDHLDAPIRRITGPDSPAMPFAPVLEEAFMPSVEHIAATLRELVAY